MNCYTIIAKITKRNRVKRGPNYPQKTIGMAPYGDQLFNTRKTQSLPCLKVLSRFSGAQSYLPTCTSLRWTLPLIKRHLNLKLSLIWMIHCRSYLSKSVLLCKILWVLCWTMRTAVTLQKALLQEPSLEQNRRTEANKSLISPSCPLQMVGQLVAPLLQLCLMN